MTTYTPEQITLMARLVPEAEVRILHHGEAWAQAYSRSWQPWADTEAGRSDALALLAAVYKAAVQMTPEICICEDCAPWYAAVISALESGDVQQIQHATCQAALAIGETMKGE